MGAFASLPFLRVLFTIIVALVFGIGGLQSVSATAMPSNDELRAAIVALEARVAALEAQLQQKTNTHQEASIPRPTLVALVEQAPNYSPMSLGTQHQASQSMPPNGWSGFYWGTSFGYAAGKSSSRYQSVSHSHDEDVSVDRDVDFNEDGSIEDIDINVNRSLSDSTYLVDGLTSDDDTDGALADLYLGGNVRLAPRIIAGLQFEGSLAQMAFRSRTNGENVSSDRTETDISAFNSSECCSSSDVDRSKEHQSEHFDYPGLNEVELDWMVSVIGRAGVLATPTTFLYGLAGWSYGHFEVERLAYNFGLDKLADYDADGPTVGGGFEQKLSSKWSLRGEYRYTDFGTQNFTTRARYNNTSSDSEAQSGLESFFENDAPTSRVTSGTGHSQSFDNETVTAKGSIANDMHVVRLGVTRFFSVGD